MTMTMWCSILSSPQRQVCQYMTTVMTQFGRPSVAVRLFSLDGILPLYGNLKPYIFGECKHSVQPLLLLTSHNVVQL